MINECECEAMKVGEAHDSIKIHADRIVKKLEQTAREHPELASDEHFRYMIDMYKKRSQTGSVEDPDRPSSSQPHTSTGTVSTIPISEHHLDTREDKIAFINQNSGFGNRHNDEINRLKK